MINLAVGACTGTHRAFVCGEAGQPLLHLDTPSSASWVTPASISLFSGQDTSLTAQGDAHLTAAHTVSAVSGQTTSLYTHSGGIKAITANAGLSLRAHTDAQQIWSDKDLTVQSTTDEIRIQASSSITLTAGQSQIEIKGGNITFTCPGTWTVKGAAHAWAGPGSQVAQLPKLPKGAALPATPAHTLYEVFDEQVVFVSDLGSAIDGRLRYAVDNPADQEQRLVGQTPKRGETGRLGTDVAQPLDAALRYARFKFNV